MFLYNLIYWFHDNMLQIWVPVPKEEVLRSKEEHRKESRTGAIPKLLNDQENNVQKMGTVPKREDEDVTACDVYLMPPPPPPPPLLEKVNVDPVVPAETASKKPSPRNQNPLVYAKSFTIAELQQYTNSFSSDHLLGAGMLGSVYRAQLPDGKVCNDKFGLLKYILLCFGLYGTCLEFSYCSHFCAR